MAELQTMRKVRRGGTACWLSALPLVFSRFLFAGMFRSLGLEPRHIAFRIKTTDSNHPDPIAPNVLERNFHVDLPNTARVTDVTYVFTHQGSKLLTTFTIAEKSPGAFGNGEAMALDAAARLYVFDARTDAVQVYR